MLQIHVEHMAQHMVTAGIFVILLVLLLSNSCKLLLKQKPIMKLHQILPTGHQPPAHLIAPVGAVEGGGRAVDAWGRSPRAAQAWLGLAPTVVSHAGGRRGRSHAGPGWSWTHAASRPSEPSWSSCHATDPSSEGHHCYTMLTWVSHANTTAFPSLTICCVGCCHRRCQERHERQMWAALDPCSP